MSRITAVALIREYGLSRAVAENVINAGRQQAMHRHWQCWALILVPGVLLLVLAWGLKLHGAVAFCGAVSVLGVQLAGWLADRYAEPEVRRMAQEKASRLSGADIVPRPVCMWPELQSH